jgi:hypothetical protein
MQTSKSVQTCVIIDIATISEKFTWNFDFEIPATQNCGHPTSMVLNSDWSGLR